MSENAPTAAAAPGATDRPIALITGASRGLGAALAVALAPSHHVIAVARTTGGLEEVDDMIQSAGGSATLAPMDVTDDDAMAHLCRSVHDRWGRVDLWCHTAIHAIALGPADHLAAKDWDTALRVNATTAQRLIPMVAPLLRAAPAGRAVFFDDADVAGKFRAGYGSTKQAQIALARAWSAETERTGPRVDIVTPRPMPTALRARFHPGEDRAALATPADEAARLLAELGLPGA